MRKSKIETTEDNGYITIEQVGVVGDFDYEWQFNFSSGVIEFCVDDSEGGSKSTELTEEQTRKVFDKMKEFYI